MITGHIWHRKLQFQLPEYETLPTQQPEYWDNHLCQAYAMACKGHVTSLITWPFNALYAISYCNRASISNGFQDIHHQDMLPVTNTLTKEQTHTLMNEWTNNLHNVLQITIPSSEGNNVKTCSTKTTEISIRKYKIHQPIVITQARCILVLTSIQDQHKMCKGVPPHPPPQKIDPIQCSIIISLITRNSEANFYSSIFNTGACFVTIFYC